MKWIPIILLLFCAGCGLWPQAAKPDYYVNSLREIKEDVDDVAGARTLE